MEIRQNRKVVNLRQKRGVGEDGVLLLLSLVKRHAPGCLHQSCQQWNLTSTSTICAKWPLGTATKQLSFPLAMEPDSLICEACCRSISPSPSTRRREEKRSSARQRCPPIRVCRPKGLRSLQSFVSARHWSWFAPGAPPPNTACKTPSHRVLVPQEPNRPVLRAFAERNL